MDLRAESRSFEQALPSDIHADLVETLFGTVGSFLSGIVGGLTVPALAWMMTGDLAILACAAVLTVFAVVRISVFVLYSRTEVTARRLHATRWEAAYALGGIGFMSTVGVLAAITLDGRHDGLTALYGMVSMLGCAGSLAGRNASRPRIVTGQILGLLAPLCAALLLRFDLWYWDLAFVLILIFTSVLSTTKFLNQMLVSALLSDRESRRRGQQLSIALDSMTHGLCMATRDGSITVLNRRLRDAFGLSETAPPASLDALARAIADHGAMPIEAEASFSATFRGHIDGREPRHWIEVVGARTVLFRSQPMDHGGSVVVVEDVTEARRSAQKIEYLAHFDALTGLVNRFQFHQELDAALAAPREEAGVALLSIDLDRFKEINDTLGHATGDALLRQVADRLRIIGGPSATVARFGGDEFQLLLPLRAIATSRVPAAGEASLPLMAHHENSVSVEAPISVGALITSKESTLAASLTSSGAPSATGPDLDAFAEAVISRLSEPYVVDRQSVSIGASIGIAAAPDDATETGDLIRCADVALYGAKGAARGTALRFTPEMDAVIRRRRQTERELRDALAAGHIEVFYQPTVDLRTGRVSACEALVRWRHPLRGLVPPDDFIPIAEECGLIADLGEFVLRRACEDALHWPPEVRVAVNVSPKQFLLRRDLVERIEAILVETGLPSSRLEIEITESTLLDARTALSKFAANGVRISLDDFGTGYNSLSYLRLFTIHKIKIDRSFVRICDRASLAIIEAVAFLAETLDMDLVVEGVETSDQLKIMADRRIHLIQGYLFSKPKPLAEIIPLLNGKLDVAAYSLRCVA